LTYCLTVTNKCNWNCEYCISDTHNNNRIYEDALDLVKTIPDNSNVAISGGEPGLLTQEQLMKIILLLKDKNSIISIKSNGQIFKHKEVLKEIDSIQYHCSENLDINDIVIKDYKDLTKFLVVITDNNIHNLRNFLEYHNDIEIEIIPSVFIKPLSKKNLILLYKEFKEYFNNINDIFKERSKVHKI